MLAWRKAQVTSATEMFFREAAGPVAASERIQRTTQRLGVPAWTSSRRK